VNEAKEAMAAATMAENFMVVAVVSVTENIVVVADEGITIDRESKL